MPRLLAWLAVGCTATASPFLYTFNAPAVTTGAVTGNAFSFTVIAPQFIFDYATDGIPLTFNISGSPDPALPVGIGIGFGQLGGTFTYSDLVSQSISGVLSVSPLVMNHVGVFTGTWKLIRQINSPNPIVGDTVAATMVITDLGAQSVPEPGSVLLTGAGLGLFVLRRRRATA